MPTHIQRSASIEAAGNKPKRIEKYVGCVNPATEAVSVARMVSPAGWVEPRQTRQFDEYAIVLRGMLRATMRERVLDDRAAHAVITHAGEWMQYGTPEDEGAEYVAVCLPAFSPDSAHRHA